MNYEYLKNKNLTIQFFRPEQFFEKSAGNIWFQELPSKKTTYQIDDSGIINQKRVLQDFSEKL